MILPITIYGNPVLKSDNTEVTDNYPNLQELIKNMFDTIHQNNGMGIGLAAPQINHNIQLMIMDLTGAEKRAKDIKNPGPRVCINPTLIEQSKALYTGEEACLSIPNLYVVVSRPQKIRVAYYDENFMMQEETLENFEAKVFLHELDHLHGKLITDYLTAKQQLQLKNKLIQMKQGRIIPQYPIIPNRPS